MVKRDIKGRWHSGFTLMEMLITVSILVILLALSAVGIARYRDYLKLTELDNAARDIFMAAENRAVLLQNSGRMGTSAALLSNIETPSGSGLYMLSNATPSDTLNELLPPGVIDPDLRERHFRVIYDETTGHVVEAFYAEGEFGNTIPSGYTEPLDPFRQSRSKRVSEYRSKTTPRLVGYYGSEAGENIGTKPLPTPGVEVLITNGDELTLTVRFALPGGLPSGVSYEPSVELKYPGLTAPIDLWTHPRREPTGDFTGTATYTWVLDSLDTSKRFQGLVSGALGGNFTVTAGLKLKAEGYIESAYYAQDTDNSLFAEESTADTAYIANLRHLQNLHPGYSNVGGDIKNARQLVNIDCEKARRNDGPNITPDGESYPFIPITNSNLKSYEPYDAVPKNISNLYVSTFGNAGLFGKIEGTDAAHPATVKGVRMINASVKTTGGSAGALAGDAINTNFTDVHVINYVENAKVSGNSAGGMVGSLTGGTLDGCRVYWSKPEELVTGTPKTIDYKVSGSDAGGLVGSASGTAEIKNSFAATTVKGAATAGGLVGKVANGSSVTVTNSYADCYLNGSNGNAEVGGLVGSNSGSGAVKLANCYAAGFIVDPTTSTKTAGLVNGDVTAASNTYSVVRTISGGSLGRPGKPLYDGVSSIVSDDVRYLNDTSTAFNPTGNVFVTSPETHPYNLRHKQDDTAEELEPPYIFLGLRDTEGQAIPHYGDWCGAPPAVIRGMVYYEEYAHEGTVTDAYGVPNDSNFVGAEGKFIVGGDEYTDFNAYPLWEDYGNGGIGEKNNPVVVRDGYALLFMGGSVALGKYEVKYGDAQIWTLEAVDGKLTWSCKWATEEYAGKYGETPPNETARSFTLPRPKNPDGSYADVCSDLSEENYILVLLPDAVVTGNFAYGDKFYQKLTASKVGDAAESGANAANFYFNPLFAKTIKKEDKTTALTAGTNPDKVSIRTARHLYDLSRLYDTSALYNDSKIDENDRDFIKGDGANSYVRNNYYEQGYSFRQELDIDYATYTWYGAEPTLRDDGYREQHPIGIGIFGLTSEAEYTKFNPSFKSNYDGSCHIIRNVIFRGTGYYLGLFGMTDKYNLDEDPEGAPKRVPRLENIVYELDPVVTVTYFVSDTAGTENQDAGYFRAIGALAGKNDGIMENCAVYGVNMEVRSKYAGGLLGYNQDTVTNCAAELASLTVTLYNDSDEISCAGGLVGKQNGDSCKIENSYAVGKLTGLTVNNTAGEAIAGLVAHKGEVKNCYAAVDLVVNSGVSNVVRFGLCRDIASSNDIVKTITNSHWLKDVFVYRGEKYNITATTDYKDSDRGVTLIELSERLTGWNQADDTVLNIPSGASYAPTYEGKSFPYLTGVTTTLERNLDGSIAGKDTSNSKPIHYGLWPAPLPVGLAYYEQYAGQANVGAHGQYENQNITNLEKAANNPVVTKDGYALVFEGTDVDVPYGDYAVKYGNTNVQNWTLTKNADGTYEWKFGGTTRQTFNKGDILTTTQTTGTGASEVTKTYTLVPLPDEIVTGPLSEGDIVTAKFYQKLVYGPTLYSERTYYFNPHFAKTVMATAPETYIEEGKTLVAPEHAALTSTSKIPVWAVMCWEIEELWGKQIISVRTPRHFYALSCFQDYYSSDSKRYYFKQELDLDYNPYKWDEYSWPQYRSSDGEMKDRNTPLLLPLFTAFNYCYLSGLSSS